MIILKNGKRLDHCKIIREDSTNVYFQLKKDGIKISTFANKESIQDYKYGTTLERITLPISEDNPKEFYQWKIYKYTKMKNTGTVFGIGGAALTIVGIILASNADWTEVDNNTNNSVGYSKNYNTSNASGFAGVLMIAVGVPISITGITLGTIGSRNVKKYREKLNNISFVVKAQNI